MNKLVSFKNFSKDADKITFSDASVVVDKSNIPLGFIFGRDSFISLCTVIDDEFEKRVNDPKKAFNNPAGKLIDLIEERLPVNPEFVKGMKDARVKARKNGWISLEEVERSLNV